jgi:hypothetical protein
MKKLLLALMLLVALRVNAVPPGTLEWDYVFPHPGVHFEVWYSTDLTHWALLCDTDVTYCRIPPLTHETFFRCRAVDDNTLVSDWSNIAANDLTQDESQLLDYLIDNANR